MSEQLDYGTVKITIITGWIPFPWHTWRNDIRIRVDDDQIALIEAHRNHQLAVEDSVIGWRRILCITCDTDLWSAHRQ